MRTEAAIRKEYERMNRSKYWKYYAHEIGALAWVLGYAPTIRKGVQEVFDTKQTTAPNEPTVPIE